MRPLRPSIRRARMLLLIVGLTLLAILVPRAAVLADAPVALHDRVTDTAGVLSDVEREQAQAAVDRLDQDENVQLFVLFVASVNGMTVTDFADEVAALSSLGGNDALLVVAVSDRLDAIWVGPLLTEASDAEIDALLANGVEPNLADGAWGAAVEAAASGLADALAGTPTQPTPIPTVAPTAEPAQSSTGSFPWGALLGIGLLAAGVVAVGVWWRRRQLAGLDAEERDRRLGSLARQANAQLIEVDELIRDDAQELAFAEAEFGKEAATAFATALDSARDELRAAFGVRQRLDDSQPETTEQREAMLREIVERTTRARAVLEEQTKRFGELRDLERRAPEVLAQQPAAIAEVESRLAEAEEQLAALRRDAAGSSQAVAGNLEEARKRLQLANRTTREGTDSLAKGDRAAASRAALAVRDTVAQASALLQSVAREHATLEEARQNLAGALSQAAQDVTAAETALQGLEAAELSKLLGEAQAGLVAARQAEAGPERDLVAAYRRARDAEATADRVVAAAREGRERRERELAATDAAIRAAEVSVDRAEEFVRSRRHGVQQTPRTRLSEANEALALARSHRDSDPASAAGEARRAGQLADEAYRMAAEQFARTERAGYGGTVVINGRHYPTGPRAGWGADVGGAVLGGIIGSILSGGGRPGQFRGPGRGPFGGGFGRGGGGGGGRTFGGGFGRGGGGGRSRGGAW